MNDQTKNNINVIAKRLDWEQLAIEIMKKNNQTDTRLYQKLINNEKLPISTEYYCDVDIINGVRFQRNFKNVNLALVDQGNCGDEICNLS